MNNIIFYSNYCENSKKVLTELSKAQIKEELYYICIDKRRKHPNGAIYIMLENGQEIIMPPSVTAVPCLLLINNGHKTILGDDIISHFMPKKDVLNNQVNEEPLAFSFDMSSSMSDTYSYLDQDPNEMLVKGKGGTRQMHNFQNLNKDVPIETPPEDYTKEKTADDALQKFEQSRNADTAKYLRQ